MELINSLCDGYGCNVSNLTKLTRTCSCRTPVSYIFFTDLANYTKEESLADVFFLVTTPYNLMYLLSFCGVLFVHFFRGLGLVGLVLVDMAKGIWILFDLVCFSGLDLLS